LLEILTKPGNQNFDELVLIHIAQRGAVKGGQILRENEMRDLVQQLERCPEPLTSPTGQPTLIHMSADQLQREFTRQSSQ